MEAWLMDRPLVLAYIIALVAGSLVSFIILIVRINNDKRLQRYPVTAWPLPGIDFLIFILSLICWFVLSGVVLLQVHAWLVHREQEPGPWFSIIGGFILQVGMLLLFLHFRFRNRSHNEGPVSPRILGTEQGIRLGLFYFLASLPVIYGVSAGWNLFLEMLRERGMEIDLPLQDAVLLFRDADNPLVLGGLLFLAVVVAPVVEESVFRAGIYRFFKGRTSITLSLLASGLLFGLIHGNLQSLPGLVAVGVCLGLAYELSGNLRVPIFFHAFFNLNSVLWILILPDALTG